MVLVVAVAVSAADMVDYNVVEAAVAAVQGVQAEAVVVAVN